MPKSTISDFIAKSNKDTPFEERCKQFEDKIKPFVEELGVMPWAGLAMTNEAIAATPLWRDMWEKKV